MRYIRYAFLAALAVVLVTVALANRDLVTLNLLPAELANLTGVSLAISLPMFVVIFGAIIAGLLIGFVWEWMREYKHRSAASMHKREKEKLAREVDKLKTQKAKNEGDEVLALLDN
ncbi:lipopolysaccharide assembly protein LapA domain-containing protein [Celeribacter litoreus]|uniref:lipopolysaccharide assembly protein LapA domain-containing protein n=1 Tax=Celeribacter litoreus TaxID=2876714 RepID=UPI001CCDBEA0|nr:LapA family protein [Celeribacter litoreus]MCA0044188.1 LapA family protein [Celeribacter litoreus]